MITRYKPKEISAISGPVTSSNRRNAINQPATDLRNQTVFQFLSAAGITQDGTICVIGESEDRIDVINALIRRNPKPWVLVGSRQDENRLCAELEPEWKSDSIQENLPYGNGAMLLRNPYNAYLEICEFVENWNQDHFVILHLGNGLQAGIELLNVLNTLDQCLIICDSVPRSLRNRETHTLTPLEFMRQMAYLMVFSAGSATKDLIELLPTYQYEKVSNTSGINDFTSHSVFHPFHVQRGRGMSWNQTRTMEYAKHVFEMDDLQRIFEDGNVLAYNADHNSVYLAYLKGRR